MAQNPDVDSGLMLFTEIYYNLLWDVKQSHAKEPSWKTEKKPPILGGFL